MRSEQIYHAKICVVTGAASGIGRALAVQLARAGAALAISDIDAEGLQETAELVGNRSFGKLLVNHLDIADGSAVLDYALHVQASLGPADYLFNVAGLTRVGNFDETPISSMKKVLDVNFWGAVRLTQAFLPQLKATRGGLVNVASLFSLISFAGQAPYCASKFALRGFSESLAMELAEDGVRVSVVCPGAVDTNITRNAEVDALPERVESREHLNAMFKKIAHTSAEQAAQIILEGTAKGKLQILVGKDSKRAALLQRLFPQYYVKLMIKKAQKRRSKANRKETAFG